MENQQSLFNHKITGTSGFVLVLLVLALIGLGERVLYDLSRYFVGPKFDYFNNLSTLLVHTLFVLFLIIVAVIVNVVVSEKKQKYAIVLIPYFILAIVLAGQVALEAAVYFYSHHTQPQFYLVMSTLVIVSSLAIYHIQKRFVPSESSIHIANAVKRISGLFVVGIIILILVVLYSIRFLLFW